MSEDCLFCKMFAGTIKADEVYRDADMIAIRDIKPTAPTHILVIPGKHIANLHEFSASGETGLLGKVMARAGEIGRAHGRHGYRVVVNEGSDAGQSVFHLHAHVIAGAAMGWPPFP